MTQHTSAATNTAGPSRLFLLDILRGLAALYVMLGHARWLLAAPYEQYAALHAERPAYLVGILAHALAYGHQAVLLFFLLSGFCIHYRQARLSASSLARHIHPPPPFDLPDFAARRIRRLYPPLLLALAFTALCDAIGSSINPSFYGGRGPYALINDSLLSGSYTPATLLGNLLMQGSFAVTVLGSNAPLWSLAYESWFYILYPFLLLIYTRFRHIPPIVLVAGCSLLAASLARLQPSWLPLWMLSVLEYWIVWTAGAFLADRFVSSRPLWSLRTLAILGIAAIVALSVLDRAQRVGVVAIRLPNDVSDLSWGASFTCLLAYFILDPSSLGARILSAAHRVLKPLGDISYSLYVLHFPWLMLLSAWWLSTHESLPLGPELTLFGVFSALAIAILGWHLVERHFITPSSRRSALTRATSSEP